MRMIFSRKGFDSGAGRVPSPIIDDQLHSLPIPTAHRSVTTYAELGYGDIVRDLTRGRITAKSLCHHDPDLRHGALGQVGKAQAHLEKHGVGVGDLFLFWGLFRRAENTPNGYRFVRSSPREHWLFGWLQVGEVVSLGPNGSWAKRRYPVLSHYPHCRRGWEPNNTLYLATNEACLDGEPSGLPGAGTFPHAEDILRLTAQDGNTSLWAVPDWLNPRCGGVGLTYHRNLARWGRFTLQTVARGQEFVTQTEIGPDGSAWLRQLFAEALE